MTILATGTALVMPDYQVFTVCDPEHDYDLDPATASGEAFAHIIGCSGEELIIRCAQDRLRARVSIEVHDGAPTDPPPGDDWSALGDHRLRFASGLLTVVETGAGGQLELALPAGAGTYLLDAHHQGRERAVAEAAAIAELMRTAGTDDRLTAFATADGTECYLLRLWPAS